MAGNSLPEERFFKNSLVVKNCHAKKTKLIKQRKQFSWN